MSNLQIIEELCGICKDLAAIVVKQQNLLEQHDAVAATEDIERAKERYAALLSRGEWPDSTAQEDE